MPYAPLVLTCLAAYQMPCYRALAWNEQVKTLIASYCEPDKPSLNWQLHALFASYLALQSDQIDFLVTIPTGTEHFLNPQIPYRIRDPIHPDLQHPRLESIGFGTGYVFANHFLAIEDLAEDLEDRYDHILLTDVDTILLPSFKTFTPPNFLVGRGQYSTDYNHGRLRRFAEKHGFKKFGRYRNIGPTWYGTADLVVQSAQQAKELVHPLLYEEDWTEAAWPEWWIGVLTMYAAEITINELVEDLQIEEGVLDASPSCTESDTAIHLHMWPVDWSAGFSKHGFEAKFYDTAEVSLSGHAKYALDRARQGVRLQERSANRRLADTASDDMKNTTQTLEWLFVELDALQQRVQELEDANAPPLLSWKPPGGGVSQQPQQAVYPVRRREVLEFEIEEDLVLLLPSSDDALRLTPSGRAIWTLCDGQHTLNDIMRALPQRDMSGNGEATWAKGAYPPQQKGETSPGATHDDGQDILTILHNFIDTRATPSLERTTRPKQRDGVYESRAGDEMLLFSPGEEDGFSISASGQAIWELCDGSHTIEDISHELQRRYRCTESDLSDDLTMAVLKLHEIGMLEFEVA